jgi:hypothetical protein
MVRVRRPRAAPSSAVRRLRMVREMVSRDWSDGVQEPPSLVPVERHDRSVLSDAATGDRDWVARSARRSTTNAYGREPAMFFFFSNRLGCIGSLLVSALITVVLLAMFGILRF